MSISPFYPNPYLLLQYSLLCVCSRCRRWHKREYALIRGNESTLTCFFSEHLWPHQTHTHLKTGDGTPSGAGSGRRGLDWVWNAFHTQTFKEGKKELWHSWVHLVEALPLMFNLEAEGGTDWKAGWRERWWKCWVCWNSAALHQRLWVPSPLHLYTDSDKGEYARTQQRERPGYERGGRREWSEAHKRGSSGELSQIWLMEAVLAAISSLPLSFIVPSPFLSWGDLPPPFCSLSEKWSCAPGGGSD